MDIDLESAKMKSESLSSTKKYRIVTNEITTKGGLTEEINDPNSDAQSLVSFIEEIEFEEKELLKKLNKQIETGIISYHNPQVDSVKDINNSWVCNFKAKYLYINSDYKSDFEKMFLILTKQEPLTLWN